MTQKKNAPYEVQVGKFPNGKYVAVRDREPYFCFLGDSRKEVLALAHEAMEHFQLLKLEDRSAESVARGNINPCKPIELSNENFEAIQNSFAA